MVRLRDYQENYINGLKKSYSKGHKKVILCAPTGAGKTIMFSFMTLKANEKQKKILILTDRKELFSQSDSVLTRFGLNPSLINPNSKMNLKSNLYVGMIQTIMRRLDKLKEWIKTIDLIIIDEAHKSIFDKLFDYIEEKTYVIGATATPFRDGKQKALKCFYSDIIQEIDTPELISKGNLSKPTSYGVKIDLKGIKTKGGDYDEKSMAEKFSELKLFHGVYENYIKITPNKKAIVFCPNIDSSKELVESFNYKGLNARHVDCYMNDREDILKWFEETPGAILSNYGILTTGFDCPTIEVVILYRATKSLPLFLQMVGRGSRVTETKKDFTILDFGNNIRKHDYWESPRTWSLDKKEKKDGEAPIKECPECFYLMPARIMECPNCGYFFQLTEKQIEEKEIVQLQLLTKKELISYVANASFKELELLAKAKGYKETWLYHQLKTPEDFKAYEKYKGYKKGWANYQIKKRF